MFPGPDFLYVSMFSFGPPSATAGLSFIDLRKKANRSGSRYSDCYVSKRMIKSVNCVVSRVRMTSFRGSFCGLCFWKIHFVHIDNAATD